MTPMTAIWVGLFVLVVGILIFDLGFVHRKGRHLSLKESLGWTMLWFAVGAAFSGVVYYVFQNGLIVQQPGHEPYDGKRAVIAYLTTWILELSLSLDNIFVMALIFKRWQVPSDHHHTVLFWGILGAVVFRTLMVFLGVELVVKFQWLLALFGLYLLYQGGKSLYQALKHEDKSDEIEPLPEKWYGLPMSSHMEDGKFIVTENGVKMVTPMLAALVAIELTDIVFALDSVPAALSVTTEHWIIISSNVLAIIGLRSLYTLLANVLERFHELHIALGLLLMYIGTKMCLLFFKIHIPNLVSLTIIICLIGWGITKGVLRERKAGTFDNM